MFFGISRFVSLLFFAFLLGAGAAPQAWAQQKSAYLDLGPNSLMPAGWAEFCLRYKNECQPIAKPIREIESSDANLILINRVNRQVNHSIKPLADFNHWKEVDRWDYAEDGSGDCEDYALVKRKLLIAAGVPQSALLMAVVRDENMDGHAVLVVRTDRGDIVLDNNCDDMKLWSRTPYRFVKIQSAADPNVWVSVGGASARPQLVSR